MKKPTLEQVKEHFKDAKVVRCLSDYKLFDISNFTDYRKYSLETIAGLDDFDDSENDEFVSLHNEKDGYAEIIEYKETKMNQKLIEQLRNGEIAVVNDGTLEQLREVLGKAFTETVITTHGHYKYYQSWRGNEREYNPTDDTDLPKVSIKDFYQEEETKQDKIARLKKELELLEKEEELIVGKWYKSEDERGCTLVLFQGMNKTTYGFAHYGDWIEQALWFCEDIFEDNFGQNGKLLKPANDKEVEYALIKEAKKRGFKDGVILKKEGINQMAHSVGKPIKGMKYTNGSLDSVNHCGFIFNNGKWAEIITPKEITVDGITYIQKL